MDGAEKGGAHTGRGKHAREGLAAFSSPQAVRRGIIFWEITCRLQTRAPSLGWAAYRGSLEHLRGWCLCCARHFRGFISCSEPAAGRSYAHFAEGSVGRLWASVSALRLQGPAWGGRYSYSSTRKGSRSWGWERCRQCGQGPPRTRDGGVPASLGLCLRAGPQETGVPIPGTSLESHPERP